MPAQEWNCFALSEARRLGPVPSRAKDDAIASGWRGRSRPIPFPLCRSLKFLGPGPTGE